MDLFVSWVPCKSALSSSPLLTLFPSSLSFPSPTLSSFPLSSPLLPLSFYPFLFSSTFPSPEEQLYRALAKPCLSEKGKKSKHFFLPPFHAFSQLLLAQILLSLMHLLCLDLFRNHLRAPHIPEVLHPSLCLPLLVLLSLPAEI